MSEILLNILKEAQDEHGYLSEHVLKQISIEHDIPIARLYGMVQFYTMLRTEPQGKYVIELCGSPTCTLKKSQDIEDFLEKELGSEVGCTTKDKLFSLYKTSCIGCCDESPAMLVNGQPFTNLTVQRVKDIIKKLRKDADTKADKS